MCSCVFCIMYVTVVCTRISYDITLIPFYQQRSAPNSEVHTHSVSLIVYPLSSLFCLNMHAEEEHMYSQGYILWESLDQNRTGLNWMMLKEELTSFSALIWFEVFWKEGEDYKTLTYSRSALMMWSSSTCRVFSCELIRRFITSSCLFEYCIDLHSKCGRRPWEVAMIDLYFICHNG